MANPTGPCAGRQPQFRVFKRNRLARHIFDYALSDLRYGHHTKEMTLPDTVLVIRGVLADAEEHVAQWKGER